MEVKLRMRERKVEGAITRTTLYLSWWIKDERKWRIEPLKLYLHPVKGSPQEKQGIKEQNAATLELARQIRNKRQAELDAGEFGMIAEHKKRGDFISYVEGLARAGDRNWKQAARVLRKYSPTPVSFRALNFENGQRWLKKFQEYLLENYSHNMAWLLETKTRAAIRRALKDQLIPRDFLMVVSPIRYKRPAHDFLTEAEIGKLLDTPLPEGPEIKRAILFSIFTGLRWSDYSQLKWKNIQGDYICFTQEKIEEADQLPLTENAKQILYGGKGKVVNIDQEEKIFNLPSYVRCLQVMQIWKRRAGISKKLTTHIGRHSYGHTLARAGFDPYRIQQALGQRTLDAALVYTHLVKSELKGELDKKLPAFKIKGGA